MAFALLVPLIFTAQVATGSGAAEAYCAGANSPNTGQLIVGGYVYASETAMPNTCNNDRNYYASFNSSFNNWRATVILSDVFGNQLVFPGSSYSTATNYMNPTINPNQYTRITLCLDNKQWGGGGIYCGWGAWYRYSDTIYDAYYYGSNTGY